MKTKIKSNVYIDGENISYKKANKIMAFARERNLSDVRVYGRQKDESTKGWTDEAKKYGMKEIRLYGGAEKNKVDNKIMKDLEKNVVRQKNITTILIVSSDGDYAKTVKYLRQEGKKVIVMGEEKTPDCLRKSGSEFILI